VTLHVANSDKQSCAAGQRNRGRLAHDCLVFKDTS
jgi:hypothetical protein